MGTDRMVVCLTIVLLMVSDPILSAHQYRPRDLGPSPFVDESTGQCMLTACDALGRARDELYTVLHEKEKVQTVTGTVMNQLQHTFSDINSKTETIQHLVTQMDKRLRSLEQPGAYTSKENSKVSRTTLRQSRFMYMPPPD